MSELIGYNYVKERGRVYSAELPKGFDNDAASRIEVLQRMVEMHQAKLEEAERRIETIERKLNHRGGQE